jgi:hypothetical protein
LTTPSCKIAKKNLEIGQSAYQISIASGSEVIDLTELNTTEGSDGESFMMNVEDEAVRNTTRGTNPIHKRLLKKETKRLTAGIHACNEAHHVGRRQIRRKRENRNGKT